MRRRFAIAATLALHGAVIGVLLALPRTEPLLAPPRRDAVVEIVEVVRPARSPAPARDAGGGAPALPVAPPAPAPAVVRTVAPPVPAPAVVRVAAPPVATARAVIAYVDVPTRGDGGSGGGLGGGQGTGIGIGTGAGLGGDGLGGATQRGESSVANLAIPAPRPVSKARPARLIYPANNRKTDPSEHFVARVDVDTDGYVVGAKLVHGFGGRRDEQASALIWRFRYAPALDDDGRPIRSTLDQAFLVGR